MKCYSLAQALQNQLFIIENLVEWFKNIPIAEVENVLIEINDPYNHCKNLSKNLFYILNDYPPIILYNEFIYNVIINSQ